MVLAEKKKAENISEYIIYMYQTELLVRSVDLDFDKVKTGVVDSIPEGSANKEELASWYANVIAQMKAEGLEKTGHLASVQQEVQQLSDLSVKLLGENTDYAEVFNAARPAIRETIISSKGLVNDPIQACLNGVFGLLLSRMNGIEVKQEHMNMVELFGNVLSYLSYYYKESEIQK